MISMSFVVQLVIGALIIVVAWWGLDQIALPEPINKILRVVLVLAIVVWLINLLLPLGGMHPLFR